MEMQAVKTQFNSALNLCITNVKHLGSQTYAYGSRAISYVTPKITELVGKIKGLQLLSFVKDFRVFASTNLGMSILALSGGVTAFVIAGKSESRFAKVSFRIIGVAALVFSALAASGAIITPTGLTFTPGRPYIPSIARM